MSAKELIKNPLIVINSSFSIRYCFKEF